MCKFTANNKCSIAYVDKQRIHIKHLTVATSNTRRYLILAKRIKTCFPTRNFLTHDLSLASQNYISWRLELELEAFNLQTVVIAQLVYDVNAYFLLIDSGKNSTCQAPIPVHWWTS